jgi:hypothetical protein
MFTDLEALDWRDCGRAYTRVEQQIQQLTRETGQRSEIYRILWQHGGRCGRE